MKICVQLSMPLPSQSLCLPHSFKSQNSHVLHRNTLPLLSALERAMKILLQAWWCASPTPACGRWRLEDQELEARLGCMRPCLKTKIRNQYHQVGSLISREYVEVGKGEKMCFTNISDTTPTSF